MWHDGSTAIRDLRRILAEGRIWVFIADSHAGAMCHYKLAVDLRDVPGLQYGTIDFCNRPTGHSAILAVLTVPKAYFSRDQLNAFADQHQLGCRADNEEADIVVLCSQAASRVTAMAFVLSITKNACSPDGPSRLN
jgi:hypothetical protein